MQCRNLWCEPEREVCIYRLAASMLYSLVPRPFPFINAYPRGKEGSVRRLCLLTDPEIYRFRHHPYLKSCKTTMTSTCITICTYMYIHITMYKYIVLSTASLSSWRDLQRVWKTQPAGNTKESRILSGKAYKLSKLMLLEVGVD